MVSLSSPSFRFRGGRYLLICRIGIKNWAFDSLGCVNQEAHCRFFSHLARPRPVKKKFDFGHSCSKVQQCRGGLPPRVPPWLLPGFLHRPFRHPCHLRIPTGLVNKQQQLAAAALVSAVLPPHRGANEKQCLRLVVTERAALVAVMAVAVAVESNHRGNRRPVDKDERRIIQRRI